MSFAQQAETQKLSLKASDDLGRFLSSNNSIYDQGLANTATFTFSIMNSSFEAPKVPGHLENMGKGIIITASGKIERQYIGAYVTSYIIRKVHMSALPI